VRQDSVVGIATRYGLDGPGIESQWGQDFSQPSRQALGPTEPPIQWEPGLFPGVKRSGPGVDHPPPSSAWVKERVELYLYSPSGPSWPVIGRTLSLPFTFVGMMQCHIIFFIIPNKNLPKYLLDRHMYVH
jgi:hypothetical protein